MSRRSAREKARTRLGRTFGLFPVDEGHSWAAGEAGVLRRE